MADETRTVEVSVRTIRFMNNSGIFNPTETAATTVGDLRTEQDLTGSVVVNDVIASDTTPLNDGDRVSHVSGGKRGGKIMQ